MPAPVRRADLLRDQLAHPPHGTRRPAGAPPPVRAGKTGTGDELLVLTWTPADLAREVAAGARLFRRLGIAPGMRVANALPGALVTPGALLLGDVMEEIGALDVPLGALDGAAPAKAAWELVDRVTPAVLVLDDASAGPLFGAMPPGERPWWRGVVWLWTSERPPAARPPVPAGFGGWQRTWLAVPEAASFVAWECERGALHVDDGVVAEVADGELLLGVRDGDTRVECYASAVPAAGLDAGCACGAPGPVLRLT